MERDSKQNHRQLMLQRKRTEMRENQGLDLDWRLLRGVDVCPEAERVRRGIVGRVVELPEVDHAIKACLGSQKGQCD